MLADPTGSQQTFLSMVDLTGNATMKCAAHHVCGAAGGDWNNIFYSAHSNSNAPITGPDGNVAGAEMAPPPGDDVCLDRVVGDAADLAPSMPI